MHASVHNALKTKAGVKVSQISGMLRQRWHLMGESKLTPFFQRTWDLAGVISLSTAAKTSATVITKGNMKAQER